MDCRDIQDTRMRIQSTIPCSHIQRLQDLQQKEQVPCLKTHDHIHGTSHHIPRILHERPKHHLHPPISFFMSKHRANLKTEEQSNICQQTKSKRGMRNT